jgi:hypothetical protein
VQPFSDGSSRRAWLHGCAGNNTASEARLERRSELWPSLFLENLVKTLMDFLRLLVSRLCVAAKHARASHFLFVSTA